jgi:pyruvate carboxylase subunit B
MDMKKGRDAGSLFQARVGDRTIDLAVGTDIVTLNERTVPFTSERLSERRLSLLIDGRSFDAVVLAEAEGVWRVLVGRRTFDVHLKNERDLLLERYGMAASAGPAVLEVRAPMPGLVLSVSVEPGQTVASGAGLLVLEAMKMENELRADRNAVVSAVHVSPGDAVGKNDLLIALEQPLPSPG